MYRYIYLEREKEKEPGQLSVSQSLALPTEHKQSHRTPALKKTSL